MQNPQLLKCMTHLQHLATGLLLYLACHSYGNSIKPNVLFIMADDLRPDLSCYGIRAITPNIQKLSDTGITFQKAYCQQALCNPSRSSMLTGLRPDTLLQWNNGSNFRERNPNVPTIPSVFKNNGYETRCVGKIFHNWHTKIKGDPTSWSKPEYLHYENHGNDKASINPKGSINLAKSPKCECLDVPDEAYFDGRISREAVNALIDCKDKPFFLAVGFWKPHAPFNAPKKYWDLYPENSISFPDLSRPENAPEIAFHDSRELLGMPPNQTKLTQENILEMRRGYLANISYLDAQLGIIVEKLKELKLTEKTIIIFQGDHGYHLGEHGLWAKTSCFELDARIPLIISAPGIMPKTATSNSLVESIDIFPTLMDLCHLSKPEKLDGISLLPVLKTPNTLIKNFAITQHPRPAYYDREPDNKPKVMGYSLRSADFRYTEWRNWENGNIIATELYDHRTDSKETKNLANSSEYIQEVTNLKIQLHKIHKPQANP